MSKFGAVSTVGPCWPASTKHRRIRPSLQSCRECRGVGVLREQRTRSHAPLKRRTVILEASHLRRATCGAHSSMREVDAPRHKQASLVRGDLVGGCNYHPNYLATDPAQENGENAAMERDCHSRN